MGHLRGMKGNINMAANEHSSFHTLY